MILAILQARFSSTRLPGKVLKPILGKPMLSMHIDRVSRCKLMDRLVIATSIESSDDGIANLCRNLNVECFRGSLADVLDRFYQSALRYRPEHVVRLTGDCPLADPGLIDQVISFHLEGGYDYTSNVVEPTYPDGLDVEICRFSCLEEAWREASLPSQREHVMPFIHQQPDRFRIGSVKNSVDLSHLRWTVDEQLDFELVSTIYESLYPINTSFTTEDILSLLETRPEFKTLNIRYQRNEGFQKTRSKDAARSHKKGL